MPQSTKHSKTQPHDHSRAPEGHLRGIEEGGRESLNETLEDGTLRGVGDDDVNTPQFTHESKATQAPEGKPGSESESRRRGLEAGGGQALNTSLEDGQLRGVNEDGQIIQGTHGGPQKHRESTDATTLRKR